MSHAPQHQPAEKTGMGSAFEEESTHTGASLQAPAFQLMAGPPMQLQEDPDTEQPVYYGTQEENTWVFDENEETGERITYTSRGDAETRMTYLRSLEEWENLEVREQAEGDETVYVVAMRGRRTVHNFIALVRKVEAAYPTYSTEDVLNGIRALAPGYNTNRWRLMLGQTAVAQPITPVEGLLTQEDIDALQSMIEHGGDTEADEQGVAMDAGGDYVAMGHVLTGTAAGLDRNTQTDLTSGAMESIGGFFGVGEYMDNLYASTIAGDLGQSAVIINNQEGVTSTTPFIGDGTEATTAELFGDVDGFNIGHQQTGQSSHPAFSSLLETYYSGVASDETANRFDTFESNATNLRDQTVRFASNYTYSVNGTGGGLFSEIGTESGYAVDQFNTWVNDQQRSASSPTTMGLGDATLAPTSGIQLVSDPSVYQISRTAYLEGGHPVRILDRGESESFNTDVIDRDNYGWTKIMVLSGPDEGRQGWVSNRFLNEQ